MTPGPDGGLGENNRSQPARYEIFEDGTYEIFKYDGNPPGTYSTIESTWEIVTEDEILVDRYESAPESMLAYRWEFGTGERGCDTIEVTTIRNDGELRPFNLYRGAVCTVQKELSGVTVVGSGSSAALA